MRTAFDQNALDGDLRVTETGPAAELISFAPAFFGSFEHLRRYALAVDSIDRIPMHADNVEEGFLVFGIAGAGTNGLGDASAGEIGLPTHNCGDCAGEITTLIAVIRNAERHQQRAEVGVAEAKRTERVRISGDLFGRITGVI